MLAGRRFFLVGLLSLHLFLVDGGRNPAAAQVTYPGRAIDIIIGFAPGGTTDLVTRMITPKLTQRWRATLNVVNMPGGNTVPAILHVMKSRPDGYTILSDASHAAMMPWALKDLPFDVMGRTYIAAVTITPMVLVVPSASPYRTLDELVAALKASPENISWASQGDVSLADIGTRQLFQSLGIDFSKPRRVMTKGGGEVVSLVGGGHVMMAVVGLPPIITPIRSGLVRPLAITSEERWRDLPGVPTTKESGYPAVDIQNWVYLGGPPNLPGNVVEAWSRSLREIMQDPAILPELQKIYVLPFFRTQSETRELMRTDIQKAGKVWEASRGKQ